MTKFGLEQLLITKNTRDTLALEDICIALIRHINCDLSESPNKNSAAEYDNDRIFSVYNDSKGTEFWIITEADRSATTVLLPEDY